VSLRQSEWPDATRARAAACERRSRRGRKVGCGSFELGIEFAALQHDDNVALRDELILAGQDPFNARLHGSKETHDLAFDFRLLADRPSGPTRHCMAT
jgi:hypothetical protein